MNTVQKRIWYCSRLPWFHKRHTAVSCKVVVVNLTKRMPPCLFWWAGKDLVRTTFFRLLTKPRFFRCACISYRKKMNTLFFIYSKLFSISDYFIHLGHTYNTILYFVVFEHASISNLKNVTNFFRIISSGAKWTNLFPARA